jgi:hypothetical protein
MTTVATIQCNGCNSHCHINLWEIAPEKQQLRQNQEMAVRKWMQQTKHCGPRR